MTSYSKETKKLLSDISDRKKCCGRLLADVMKINTSDSTEGVKILNEATAHIKCPSCFGALMRGVFILYGNVTDPEKRYHLEFSFADEVLRDAVGEITDENGLYMSRGERRGRYLLYIKDSTGIEDFFALIGANKSAFDLMNRKIVKAINNEANRQLNCDMANIKKVLSSAQPYIDAVERLRKSGAIAGLPADLKETAKLRIEYPQASMSELALRHDPPISKSGVKHRLDKIKEFSEKS